MSCVGRAPSGTVVAEDVRNLLSWTRHETGVTFAGGVSRFFDLLRSLKRSSGLSTRRFRGE
jgi:hypothetical protein